MLVGFFSIPNERHLLNLLILTSVQFYYFLENKANSFHQAGFKRGHFKEPIGTKSTQTPGWIASMSQPY